MARKVRPITQLPDDIKEKVETALAESASHMIFGLQSAGPWWTGHFAQSWVVSTSPVQPTDSSRFKEDRDKLFIYKLRINIYNEERTLFDLLKLKFIILETLINKY